MGRDREDRVSDFSIFMPKSTNAIFNDYPELKQMPEFSRLSSNDMLFVWYYACEASPFYKIVSDSERAEKAIKESYEKYAKDDQIDKKKYVNIVAGRMEEKIQEGVIRMRRFKIGPRVRAAQVIEKALENLEEIIKIDAKNRSNFLNSQGEYDFGKHKQYIECVEKASKMLPGLIKQFEEGFNVTRKKTDTEDMDTSFLDDFHEEND